MKKVILDTSFIMTCVKQKIDFFDEISKDGFKPAIPIQAIRELQGLGAATALEIIGKNRHEIIDVPGMDADSAIVKIAKKDPLAIISTLDRGLQKRIKNKKMIIRGMKKLAII